VPLAVVQSFQFIASVVSKFSDSDAHAGCIRDVAFAEQNLVQTCGELDDKKADKEFVISAVNTVSRHAMRRKLFCYIHVNTRTSGGARIFF